MNDGMPVVFEKTVPSKVTNENNFNVWKGKWKLNLTKIMYSTVNVSLANDISLLFFRTIPKICFGCVCVIYIRDSCELIWSIKWKLHLLWKGKFMWKSLLATWILGKMKKVSAYFPVNSSRWIIDLGRYTINIFPVTLIQW